MRVSLSTVVPGLFAAALLCAAGTGGAGAQSSFDVLDAVEGVWAYDVEEVASPGDFTCAERPMAIMVVDGGQRVASKRPGDEAERYGLILDVRNDFPLGPALSILWEDAPEGADGDPVATVLVMEDENSFSFVAGEVLEAYLAGSRRIERSPRRARCVG